MDSAREMRYGAPGTGARYKIRRVGRPCGFFDIFRREAPELDMLRRRRNAICTPRSGAREDEGKENEKATAIEPRRGGAGSEPCRPKKPGGEIGRSLPQKQHVAFKKAEKLLPLSHRIEFFAPLSPKESGKTPSSSLIRPYPSRSTSDARRR